MAKSTAWKIDLLMKLTGTSNSELARRLGFDASYISRIRHGKRGLPTGQPFVEPACALFAKLVRDDYQRRILADELGVPWPDSPSQAAKLLASWLQPSPDNAESIRRVVGSLGIRPPAKLETAPRSRVQGGSIAQARLYYGNEGKRDAVIAFLSALCETGAVHTLLLHSDEDMTWLYEDDAFAHEWADLLFRLIANGGKVRIIHTVSRDTGEMWEAVRKWMPLYMTGAVEPYYYPHLRDGVYRRTLFVAPGHSALAAASVGEPSRDGLNVLLDDSAAVAALEAEFDDYLALCRPLMQVAFHEVSADMAATIAGFAEPEGNVIASVGDGRLVCAREGGNALAANVDSPLVSFTIEEPRMSGALWNYLHSLPTPAAEGPNALALLAETAAALK